MRTSLILIWFIQIRLQTCEYGSSRTDCDEIFTDSDAESSIHIHRLTSEIFDSIDFPRDQTLDLQGIGIQTIDYDAFKKSSLFHRNSDSFI